MHATATISRRGCTALYTFVLCYANLVRPRPLDGVSRIEVQAVGRGHPVALGVKLVDERLASRGAHLSNETATTR